MRQPARRLPALLALLLATTASAPVAAAGNPLATRDQLRLEREAARLLATPEVRAAEADVRRAFAALPFAATAEGAATLDASAHEVAFAGVEDSLDRDGAHPRTFWVWSPAHRWFGLATPRAKVLMPNADNVFRILPVDAASRYRLTLTRTGPEPTQLSLQLLPSLPGEADWSEVIAQRVDSDLTRAPDGRIVITVGPEAGEANHVATTAGSRFLLLRDTIQDWTRERPYRLTVQRLNGPVATTSAVPGKPEASAQAAADLIRAIVSRVLAARDGGFGRSDGFFSGPANTLAPPRVREGGRWGLSASGHFQIADDEALLITLDPAGAAYLSVQLANGWLGSLDYLGHTASLNLAQSRPNPDGTVTFVAAARDPGAANWLDTTGLHEGSLFARWQKFPGPVAAQAQAVREVRLVRIADLPADLPRLTPAQRRAQVAARVAGYGTRFAR